MSLPDSAMSDYKIEAHKYQTKNLSSTFISNNAILSHLQIATRTKKIFIGGIATSSNAEEIRQYFNKFGDVENCELMMDKATNRHRGFGFVTFNDEEVAEQICHMHYHNINNKMVEAKKALPKELLSTSNSNVKPENKTIQVPLTILPNTLSPTFQMNSLLQPNGSSYSPYVSLPYLQNNSGQLLLNSNLLQIANPNGLNSIQTLDPNIFSNDLMSYLGQLNNFSTAYNIPQLTPTIPTNYMGTTLPNFSNNILPMQNVFIDLSHHSVQDPKYFSQPFLDTVKSAMYPNLKGQQSVNTQLKMEIPGSQGLVDLKDQSMSHLVARYNNNGNNIMTMMMMAGSIDGASAVLGSGLTDCSNSLDNQSSDNVWLIPAKIPRVH